MHGWAVSDVCLERWEAGMDKGGVVASPVYMGQNSVAPGGVSTFDCFELAVYDIVHSTERYSFLVQGVAADSCGSS